MPDAKISWHQVRKYNEYRSRPIIHAHSTMTETQPK